MQAHFAQQVSVAVAVGATEDPEVMKTCAAGVADRIRSGPGPDRYGFFQ